MRKSSKKWEYFQNVKRNECPQADAYFKALPRNPNIFDKQK